jgi:pilus assembly protein Flp/PilA
MRKTGAHSISVVFATPICIQDYYIREWVQCKIWEWVKCTSETGEIKMLKALKRFVREDEGLEMLEWAIVAALFATAGAVIWATLGSTVSTELTTISTSLGGSANPF